MPYLIQKSAAGALVKQWEFRGQPLTAGRGDEVDVAIEDNLMSRRHFQILPAANGYTLEDCGSANGTMLNGQRIKEPTPLKPGDRIRAGDTHFVFESALLTVMNEIENSETGYTTYVRELSNKKTPPKR